MAVEHFEGANYAKAASPLSEDYLAASQWGGKLRVQRDVATAAVASDSGSTIKIGRLPKGSIPIAVLIKGGTVSAAVTGTIGWTGSAAALGTFTTLATGTITQILTPSVPNTPMTEDTDVFITTASASLSANDYIVTALLYAAE